MTTELKPCPFCGGEADKIPRFNMGYVGDDIKCSCGAETPKHLADDAAVEWWNNRPYENKIKDDAVREALQYEPKWRVYGAEAQLHAIDEYADKIEKGEL